ncbi:MAG TPA: thioredoxin fold domain-containing protein [Burkholderiaceae bacterium]|nr:thioredoxin fold domain-containing protein [Burkholderiaceae bacterium]
MQYASPMRRLSAMALWLAAAATTAGLAQAAPAPAAAASQATATATAANPKLQALWQQVIQSKYIIQGASDATKKATVYAFFDPNCIFCHLSWRLSRHYYAEGLQVRWIPIAFLMTDSAPKAAWVLLSADPSKALAEGEGGWKGLRDGGGAFNESLVTANIQKTLDRNKKLFKDLGLTGTPGFVYKDPKGVVHVASGMSNKHLFANMTGLAYVKVDDPDLKDIPE